MRPDIHNAAVAMEAPRNPLIKPVRGLDQAQGRAPWYAARRVAVRWLVAVVLPWGIPAHGNIVPWLYDVEAPIESQGVVDRRNASRAALREMLVRLTGLRHVPMSEPVRAALRDPDPYYVGYRFLPRSAERGMRLGVSFSPEAVRGLISQAALPIWSADRPVGLGWLAAEQDGGAAVLSRDSEHPLAEGLRRRARQRGIEIALPAMDTEDAARVSVADVWFRFPYAIDRATARYEPDLVLLGHGRAQPLGQWVTEWELWLAGGKRSFSFETPTPEEGAAQAVDAVADELMNRFAVLGRDARPIEMEVRGIATVADYAGLMRRLGELEFIDRVELLAAAPATTTIRVTTRSTRSRLAELLAVYGILRADDAPRPAAGDRMTLTWMGNG